MCNIQRELDTIHSQVNKNVKEAERIGRRMYPNSPMQASKLAQQHLKHSIKHDSTIKACIDKISTALQQQGVDDNLYVSAGLSDSIPPIRVPYRYNNPNLQSKEGISNKKTSVQSQRVGLPSINGVIGPWSNEAIKEKYHQILMYLDGTNQTVGYITSVTGLTLENIKFLETTGKRTFYIGLVISLLRTDWDSSQSVIELGIGGGLSSWAYFYPWAIPFAGVYSATTIDKEYSKTLPKRAAKGYKSSHQQILNHPYFRNLDR